MSQKEEKIIDLKPNTEGVYEPAGIFTPSPQPRPQTKNNKQEHHQIRIPIKLTKFVRPQYRRQANEFVQGLEAGLNVLELLFRKLK